MPTWVRLRAERRTGELLAELSRGGGGDRKSEFAKNQMSDAATFDSPSEYARALEDNGLSRQTAHRYQQLASVPKDQFEWTANVAVRECLLFAQTGDCVGHFWDNFGTVPPIIAIIAECGKRL